MGAPVLEKLRMQTLGFARLNPEQIEKAGLSGIVDLGKGAGMLNSPMNSNERDRDGPVGRSSWNPPRKKKNTFTFWTTRRDLRQF